LRLRVAAAFFAAAERSAFVWGIANLLIRVCFLPYPNARG
jgi:hypothetical protein